MNNEQPIIKEPKTDIIVLRDMEYKNRLAEIRKMKKELGITQKTSDLIRDMINKEFAYWSKEIRSKNLEDS